MRETAYGQLTFRYSKKKIRSIPPSGYGRRVAGQASDQEAVLGTLFLAVPVGQGAMHTPIQPSQLSKNSRPYLPFGQAAGELAPRSGASQARVPRSGTSATVGLFKQILKYIRKGVFKLLQWAIFSCSLEEQRKKVSRTIADT